MKKFKLIPKPASDRKLFKDCNYIATIGIATGIGDHTGVRGDYNIFYGDTDKIWGRANGYDTMEKCIEGLGYYYKIKELTPTISLKLEGIEEGEDNKYKIIKPNGESKITIYFEDGLPYNTATGKRIDSILSSILYCGWELEKIEKTETELEIEKLRAQVAEVNAQIDKLEGTL